LITGKSLKFPNGVLLRPALDTVRAAVRIDAGPAGRAVTSNLHRPGALEGHSEWEAALREIDADWNPSWPADWQRHHAALRELLTDEHSQADNGGQTEVLHGFTVHGMDIGKWLAKQRTSAIWQALADGQRQRLQAVGVTPVAPEPEMPATPSTAPAGAFERGVTALAQYKTREGSLAVPRSHVETLPDGTEVKLGVFLSNTKTRRAKLTTDKLAALANLGLGWAT
jgi:hypothetical protein